MLGKVVEALKPTPWDQLEEATLNAALAIIASAHCRPELEALITVEIVATATCADRATCYGVTSRAITNAGIGRAPADVAGATRSGPV
jgi:hypothetical protein